MSNPAEPNYRMPPQNALCAHQFVPLPHTAITAVPHVCLRCRAEAVFDVEED